LAICPQWTGHLTLNQQRPFVDSGSIILNFQRDESFYGHLLTQLTAPETSTIMQRRNSALANNKENQSTPSQPLPNNSNSFDSKQSPGTVSKKPR